MIIAFERIAIVNWVRIVLYYMALIFLSRIFYANFISSITTLLPDFSEIKNEIWLIIIVFFYQLGNGFEEIPSNSTYEPYFAQLPELKKRKRKYIERKYVEFRSKFGTIIEKSCERNDAFTVFIIAIIIYENFNRPRLIRWFERIWVKLTHKVITIGIMQTQTNRPISDIESVKQSTKDLFEVFIEFTRSKDDFSFAKTLKSHCPDKKYIRQVLFIAKAIIEFERGVQSKNRKIEDEYSELYSEIRHEFGLYG